MDVHVIDGTYELFRYFFAVPSAKDGSGQEIGAVRGVLGSVLSMIEGGATHIRVTLGRKNRDRTMRELRRRGGSLASGHHCCANLFVNTSYRIQ